MGELRERGEGPTTPQHAVHIAEERVPWHMDAPQHALECLHGLLRADLNDFVNGILQTLVKPMPLHIRLNGRTRSRASLLPFQFLLHKGLGMGGLHSRAGARGCALKEWQAEQPLAGCLEAPRRPSCRWMALPRRNGLPLPCLRSIAGLQDTKRPRWYCSFYWNVTFFPPCHHQLS